MADKPKAKDSTPVKYNSSDIPMRKCIATGSGCDGQSLPPNKMMGGDKKTPA